MVIGLECGGIGDAQADDRVYISVSLSLFIYKTTQYDVCYDMTGPECGGIGDAQADDRVYISLSICILIPHI
jgi:hypothetical protein